MGRKTKFFDTSKSVCGFKVKNHLLFCNMNTHEARKVTCEKVKLDATLRDRNLCSSQGGMCRNEIYKTF